MSAPKAIPGLITPYSTSEFQAMVESVRRHHNGGYDQYCAVAAELRSGLKKVHGAPGLFGLDVALAARRVTKHLAVAAACELEAAKAVVRSYQMYQQLFLGRGKPGGRTFDASK